MGLEHKIEAEGAIVGSDFHGNETAVKNLFEYARENDLAVIVNGDFVNDYGFDQLRARFGYSLPQEHQMAYFQENLSQSDFQDYITIVQLQQYGGPDNLLKLVPEAQRDEARKQIEQTVERFQTDEVLAKRIEKTAEKFNLEKGAEVLEDLIQINSLYTVLMDEMAQTFAKYSNEYQDVKVAFLPGNHEPAFFVDQTRQYLNDPNQIIDLAAIRGYASIVDSDGVEMTLGGMTNCAQVMPYIQQMILDPSQYDLITAHMAPEGEYQRLHDGENRDLDVFVTHGQVGKPMFQDGREGFDVPYLEDAKKASLEAKLTVEGHIHNEYDGENEFGARMIRAAGGRAAVIKKEGNKLVTSWVTIDDNFDGNHNNSLPYDMKYLASRVEEVAEQYRAQIAQAQANQQAA